MFLFFRIDKAFKGMTFKLTLAKHNCTDILIYTEGNYKALFAGYCGRFQKIIPNLETRPLLTERLKSNENVLCKWKSFTTTRAIDFDNIERTIDFSEILYKSKYIYIMFQNISRIKLKLETISVLIIKI